MIAQNLCGGLELIFMLGNGDARTMDTVAQKDQGEITNPHPSPDGGEPKMVIFPAYIFIPSRAFEEGFPGHEGRLGHAAVEEHMPLDLAPRIGVGVLPCQ